MLKRYLICLVLVMGCLAATGFIAGGLWFFLDFPSFFLVIVPPGLVVLMSFNPAEIKTAFQHVFAGNVEQAANYKRDIALFSSLQSVMMITGVIAFFMGFIAMLSNLQDMTAIGQGFAIALLTFLYALILNLVLIVPCKSALIKKQSMQEQPETIL